MYLDKFKLTGKIAVVTGAARGIGYAAVEALAEAGATVVLTDMNPVLLDAARSELAAKGHKVDSAVLDVTDPRAVEAQTKAARETIQKSAEQLEDVFSRVQGGAGVALDDIAPVISGLSTSLDDNPAIFLSVTRLKSKDETTFLHSLSVSALMIHFARYLDFDEETVRVLGIGGLLHDVGKLEIPQEILSKEGKLDDEEMKLIRSHPELGHAILQRQAGMPEIVLDVCLNHHERIDGRGYPNMLPGSKLSIYARLAAICDVYDAITSIRPYKQPWSPAEALKWMLGREGHFDTKLLKRFALCLSVSSAPKV